MEVRMEDEKKGNLAMRLHRGILVHTHTSAVLHE